MKERYLEVTFRKGKPLAAYVYLPRSGGTKSAKTVEAASGILVDYASSGEPIGLEITAPAHVTVEHINAVLATLGLSGMTPEELAPLRAA
jgi:uncharacterized protein YuzE